MPEVCQHELAFDTVSRLDRHARFRVDQLGVDEATRA